MPHQVINTQALRGVLDRIRDKIYQPLANLEVTAWVTKEPVSFALRETGTKLSLNPGDKWGDVWDCAWFHFMGKVPVDAAGSRIVLLMDVNGELCLVDEQGSPMQGLTNVNSEFDLSLGLPGKRVVWLAEQARGDEPIDLWGDAGCNDLFGRYRSGTLKEAQIAICHEDVRQLYYDYEVLLELAEQLSDTSPRRERVVQVLYDASLLLTPVTSETVQRTRDLLAVELQRRGGDEPLKISAVGHAHLDLAWLWPLRETKRKGARTFATALKMMERYPDYVFGASQPQLYQWIKDEYPDLYARVKQRIAEGRWEVQGAMWVEPDSNIAGGEALVRQILYGKRFFQQEFGKDVNILWVPDIFGYSASLPQILKRAGVDYMMTQKLSWNMHNTYPHHSFWWEGIDGSRVLTHMPPEDTYNSPAAPRSIIKAEKQYKDKNVSDHCLMLFGIGDGGGGPGEEHLERLSREQNLLGLSPVVQEPSTAFFEKLETQSDRFEAWQGELYLEKHQGTLTTQARNKRYNRKLEKALRELEFAASLNGQLLGEAYPKAVLEEVWKEMLLYQFHDILPGSSITRVYTESLERYEAMVERIESMIYRTYQTIASHVHGGTANTTVLFNSLPWTRREWVRVGGKWTYVEVPPMGYQAVDTASNGAVSPDNGAFQTLSASKIHLENPYLRVTFASDGTIQSVYDKEHEREVIAPGQFANLLTMYQDTGDAWDFPEDYRNFPTEQMELTDCRVEQNGPEAAVIQVFQYNDSTLTQRIVLMADSRRLDFQTEVDWQEAGKMLRASFPIQIHSDSVACDIQFGHIKRTTSRNTSWEAAKDEICAHQWIDLSQPDYGVALLNDSKYGHRAAGNVLDINLLRSPGYPDPQADRAVHTFTYSLLPHAGDFVDAKVHQAGYELNVPLRVVEAAVHESANLPSAHSFVTLDAEAIVLEAVKKAEDDDAFIVRLYETNGTHVKTKLHFGFEVDAVFQTNLMEEVEAQRTTEAGGVELEFQPFEIQTVRVYRKNSL